MIDLAIAGYGGGVAIALTAALFWAIATGLYRQMSGHWTPAALAFVKSIISVAMFLAWFIAAGTAFWDHAPSTLLWLFASGIIGIAIGDTAIFYALYRMTEREALIIAETAAPILVVVAAFVVLAESLTAWQLGGMLLVIIGVDGVIGLRRGHAHYDSIGILCALLAAVCQAFGMVVSRTFLTQTDISAEETAFWRLLGAAVALPIWLLIRRESPWPALPLDPATIMRLLAAIVLGTFLGILFLQLAVASLPAGLAQALIATSIIFATILGVVRGDRVTPGQWFGVLLAVIGVGLIVA